MSTTLPTQISTNIPSNKELLSQLSHLRDVLKEHRSGNKELTEKGRQIALALERFTYNTEHMIQEKNWDNAFQQFVERSANFVNRVNKETELRHGELKKYFDQLNMIASNLKNSFVSLFSSSETRSLLVDMMQVANVLFTITVQQKEKSEEVSDISDKDKHELSERLRTVFAKVGKNPNFKQSRNEVLSMFDYWTEKLRQEEFLPQTPSSHLESKETKTSATTVPTTKTSTSSTSSSEKGSSIPIGFSKGKISPVLKKDEQEEKQLLNHFRIELKGLFDEALSIVQRFTPKLDLFKLKEKFWHLYNDICNDSNANSFFKDFRGWAHSIVENPETFDKQETVKKGDELIDRASFVRKKYGKNFQEIIDDLNQVVKALQEERYLSAYQEELQEFKELTTSGSFIETVSQFRHISLPILREMMQDIKLQPFVSTEGFGKISLDNLVLKSKEVTLDDIKIKFKFGMKELMRAEMQIKNIEAHFPDVKFAFERTTIPAISDQGVLNCRLLSKGWKIKMNVKEEQGKAPVFNLVEVKGGIKRLEIDIVEGKHTILGPIFLSWINSALRKRVRESVEQALKENGEFIVQKMNELFSSPFSLVSMLGIQSSSSSSSSSSTSSSYSGSLGETVQVRDTKTY